MNLRSIYSRYSRDVIMPTEHRVAKIMERNVQSLNPQAILPPPNPWKYRLDPAALLFGGGLIVISLFLLFSVGLPTWMTPGEPLWQGPAAAIALVFIGGTGIFGWTAIARLERYRALDVYLNNVFAEVYRLKFPETNSRPYPQKSILDQVFASRSSSRPKRFLVEGITEQQKRNTFNIYVLEGLLFEDMPSKVS